MQTTPDHENDRISEREQSSIDPQPATAPILEQVRDSADEPRATADFDEEVAPVDATAE